MAKSSKKSDPQKPRPDFLCRDFLLLGNSIQRVQSLFKYVYEAGLIDKPAIWPGLQEADSQNDPQVAGGGRPTSV